MPPEQFEEVIKALPKLELRKWNVKDVEMIFRICRYSGLRMVEATRLKVEDFDLSTNEILLGKTKTRKEDIAVIPDFFKYELKEYLERKQGGLLLDPIPTRNAVDMWIRKLGVICDIKAWTTPQSVTGEKTKMHIFRKSIGKDMVTGELTGKQAPLNVVMKMLRHESLDTTSKYLKVDQEEAKQYFKEEDKNEDDSSW